jgi:hypothetical protein
MHLEKLPHPRLLLNNETCLLRALLRKPDVSKCRRLYLPGNLVGLFVSKFKDTFLKAHIASHEDFSLFGYDDVFNGIAVPMLQRNILPPSSE